MIYDLHLKKWVRGPVAYGPFINYAGLLSYSKPRVLYMPSSHCARAIAVIHNMPSNAFAYSVI